jgi:hypothetical protein
MIPGLLTLAWDVLIMPSGGLTMRAMILTTVLSVAALTGCYTTGRVGYSATYSTGGVYATTPDLVAVAPGVHVVADYSEPVFYTDGFYWRYYDGFWYRSNNYATGWYYVNRPPVAVLRIDRPYAYRHYRPQGYVVRNRGRYRPAETIVRDHRRPAYRPEPVIRDHRAPARSYAPRGEYRAAPVREAPARAPAATPRDHRQAPPADRKESRRDRDHRN